MAPRMHVSSLRKMLLGIVLLCCVFQLVLIRSAVYQKTEQPWTRNGCFTYQTEIPIRRILKHNDKKEVPVFYNLFIKSSSAIAKAKAIAREQYALLLPFHKLLVSSIGVDISQRPGLEFFPKGSRTCFINHLSKGDERDTMELLWKYCQAVPEKEAHNSLVVYLHSKGSHHHNYVNSIMRKVTTDGALSSECANLPESCDVCSYRMSPIPFPHTPGNMWLARCSYVKKLISPSTFQSKVEELYAEKSLCYGKDRFAQEHYIHHHHDVRPCDLLDDPSFTWSYSKYLKQEYKRSLKQAPRFNISHYVKKGVCDGIGVHMRDRLELFDYIYNISHLSDIGREWYGWEFYPNSFDLATQYFTHRSYQ